VRSVLLDKLIEEYEVKSKRAAKAVGTLLRRPETPHHELADYPVGVFSRINCTKPPLTCGPKEAFL
jgi:hypothetical protein